MSLVSESRRKLYSYELSKCVFGRNYINDSNVNDTLSLSLDLQILFTPVMVHLTSLPSLQDISVACPFTFISTYYLNFCLEIFIKLCSSNIRIEIYLSHEDF